MPDDAGALPFEEHLHKHRQNLKDGIFPTTLPESESTELSADPPGWSDFVGRTLAALDAEAARQQQQIEAAYAVFEKESNTDEYKAALNTAQGQGKANVDAIIDEAYDTAIQMGTQNPEYQKTITSGMLFLSTRLAQTIQALRIPPASSGS